MALPHNNAPLTRFVKERAAELGFFHCGIARAEHLPDDAQRLENWLKKGMHGRMGYMERNFEQRTDPRKLVPGAKSVITLLMNYFPAEQQKDTTYRFSKYAYGNDYHEVIREKLNTLLAMLKEQAGNISGRGFVDSAPVLERTWAQRSGLGWVGKNGNLINKKNGSFFFIATLITDLELVYDLPLQQNFCGTCNRCVEACPTNAILPGAVIDGSKCISYYTIELKEMLIPEEVKGRFQNWVFGCDICQDVCPWNRFSQPHNEPAFSPVPEILNCTSGEWEQLTEEAFRKIFKFSAVKRTKYNGLMRNIRFLKMGDN